MWFRVWRVWGVIVPRWFTPASVLRLHAVLEHALPNPLSLSSLGVAHKKAESLARYARYARVRGAQMRFGCACAVSSYTYNPQDLYYSPLFLSR